MHEMRKIGGYMTVEASLVFPIVFLVFILFLGYGSYCLNQGIVQGVLGDEMEIAADGAQLGGNYQTGKLSYRDLNERNLVTKIYPGKEKRGAKAKSKINQRLKNTLFLGKLTKISVNPTFTGLSAQAKEQLRVPVSGWFDFFGIHLFLSSYDIKMGYQGDIETVRRWGALHESMD